LKFIHTKRLFKWYWFFEFSQISTEDIAKVALNNDRFGQKIIRETQRVTQRNSARKQRGLIFKHVNQSVYILDKHRLFPILKTIRTLLVVSVILWSNQ